MSPRRSFVRFVVVTLCALVIGLAFAGTASASPITVVGTVTNDGITHLNSAAVSNPAGAAETQGIIEVALAPFAPFGAISNASLGLNLAFTTAKTLTVSTYSGDLNLSYTDFGAGRNVVFSQLFQPTGPGGATVTIDISHVLADLLAVNAPAIGFNLFESESSGNVVTIEYLVLGTFLNLAQQVSVGHQRTNNTFGDPVVTVTAVPEPASMMLLGAGLIGLAARRYIVAR